MRWILVLGIALLSQACVNQTKMAKESMEGSMFDDRPLTYRNVAEYPGKVVCGEFTATRRKIKKGFKPFLYRAEVLNKYPTAEDTAVFCTENSLEGLYTSTGIYFSGDSKASLIRIRDDYSRLATALKQYESDNSWLPKNGQGLESLVHPSEINPKPNAFREGGYLDELPLDPWGRAYLYTGPMFAGVQGDYTLMTLGADGVKGGKDINADVGSRHIKYLDHIEQTN